MKNFIRNFGILIVTIILVGLVKLPHLSLPYSWDEAWSYLPALIEMVEKGPSIITGSIQLYSSKGHPLLFYFLNSGWVKIFSGDMSNIILVRIFPLLISLGLLISLFVTARKQISLKTANIVVVLLGVQSLFLAQASLILPEMLLALLLVLSVHFFMLKKYGWYACVASLMVLTKETGLVFVGGFGLFYIIENIKLILKKDKIINLILLSIPLVVFGIHLLLNFRAFNTFFFDDHLNYISFNPEHIKRVLKSSTAILFTRYGRNVISGIIIISLIFIFYRKEKIENGKLLVLICFQILLLTLFTSVNFYTYRYMMPAFPLFILLAVTIFEQAFSKLKVIQSLLLAIMIAAPLYFSITKKGKTDIDLGYVSYLPMHIEMVEYCEKQNWFDKKFAAEFNMVLALRDPFTGYHNSEKGFETIHLPEFESVDIIILDSTGERVELSDEQRDKFSLNQRFENKNSWGEIYVRK